MSSYGTIRVLFKNKTLKVHDDTSVGPVSYRQKSGRFSNWCLEFQIDNLLNGNHSRAPSKQHQFENLSQTSMAFSIVSDLDYFDEAMKVWKYLCSISYAWNDNCLFISYIYFLGLWWTIGTNVKVQSRRTHCQVSHDLWVMDYDAYTLIHSKLNVMKTVIFQVNDRWNTSNRHAKNERY